MTEPSWETWPPGLSDDGVLAEEVLQAHREILDHQLAGDPMLNRALGIRQRALRRLENWRLLLLLTPWMLSRLLFPDRPLPLALPPGWSGETRRGAAYQVLGPQLDFELLGQRQRGHLNYHARLGHYLLQPICLNMAPYRDEDQVFEHWNQVIRTREENLEKAMRDCPLQKEVSRRELFRRLGQPDDGDA